MDVICNTCQALYPEFIFKGICKECGNTNDFTRKSTGCCYDCGRAYGDEYGFPDLLVQKSVWKRISPTGHEGGLLCPCCIIRRLVQLGLSNVSACFVTGPLKMIGEIEMKEIFKS